MRAVPSRALGAAAVVALLAAGCVAPGFSYTPIGAYDRRMAYPFHIIAHRCGAGLAPENTLAACRRSLAAGAVELELDAQLSKDGVVVLFHDETLDRKTPLSGRVAEHTAAALTAADIGTWFDREHPEATERFAGCTLVTLEQVFHELGPRPFYHVEIKSDEPGLPARVLDLVRAAGLADRVMLTSFSLSQLERARALDPDVPISLLIDRRDRLLAGEDPATPLEVALLDAQWRRIEAAADAGFQQVAVAAEDLSPLVVSRARERGLEIRAWKIRGRDDMESAIQAGANGMTLDRPDWLVGRLVEEMAGAARPADFAPGSPPREDRRR